MTPRARGIKVIIKRSKELGDSSPPLTTTVVQEDEESDIGSALSEVGSMWVASVPTDRAVKADVVMESLKNFDHDLLLLRN